MKIGISILSIIIAMLNSLGATNIEEANVQDYVKSDCVSVADFLEDHFVTFVDEYNKETGENWEASYIEDRKEVKDIEDDETYIYLDFNDNFGYAIVGNDYNFVDFSTTKDLLYTKEADMLFWSEYDGFVYLYEDQYVSYEASFLTENELNELSYGYSGKAATSYSSGSDVIVDIDSYIKSRYGSGYYYDSTSSKSLNNYTDVTQSDYSIYGKSEGNCTLSAFYGIYRYLKYYGKFSGLRLDDIEVDVTGDSFYDSTKSINNKVPELYASIRKYAIKYGYTTESSAWTSINMTSWGNAALSDYGYHTIAGKAYAKMYLVWSFSGQVVYNINKGYPVMWNQARGNYSGHSMVVKGYKTYKKDYKVWFIKWSEKKYFMEMNDNWASTGSTTYIDYSGYSMDLINEGFGTFVVVRDYLW